MSKHHLILIVSLIAVSSAAPVAKLSEISAISLGFWRTFIIGLVLLPFAKRMSWTQLKMVGLSGVFLAFHFWTWFESLYHTSAFRSTLLVCLNPFWIAIWEQLQGTKQSKRYWIGGLISFAGVCVMSVQTGSESASLWGDFLACVGGILGAAYFIVGKKARAELDIYQYGSGSCLFSAFSLVCIAVITNTTLTLSAEEWGFAIYMALGPQLCGHIGLNYVLKYLRASFLSMLLLFEPVGAGILAFLVLAEIPTPFAILGGALVIGGLAVTIIDNDKKTTKELEKNIH